MNYSSKMPSVVGAKRHLALERLATQRQHRDLQQAKIHEAK
jgi:hypothetical protein